MWLAVFRHLLAFSAVLCTGWAIRLLDDGLDYELDLATGQPNLCRELQGGVTAYALAALALAILAQPNVALSLFAGAYAVGMLADTRLLPSRLPAWLEGLLLWALVARQAGWRLAGSGLLIMLAAQLLDDWRDGDRSRYRSGQLRRLLAGPGLGLAAATAGCLAGYLQPALLAYAVPVFLYFQWREQVVAARC